MKFLVPFLLLVLGLVCGYFVGVNQQNNSIVLPLITESSHVEIIHDTIVKKEIIEVIKKIETDSELIFNDSIFIDSLALKVDTTLIIEIELDSLNDSLFVDNDISISTDLRLKRIQLPINYLSQNKLEIDSLLKESLNIKTINNDYIIVEFWKSPINYKGYKLSKSKLILYGLSPQHEYRIFKLDDIYFLRFLSINYQLMETENFKPYNISQLYIR